MTLNKTGNELIVQIIHQLQQTSGNIAKEELLKNYSYLESLKDFLFYTYNTEFTYFMTEKLFQESLAKPQAYDVSHYRHILDRLMNRIYDRVEAKNAMLHLYHNTDTAGKELLTYLLARDIRAGISAKTLNKVYGKDFIPTTPYMRCSLLKDVEPSSLFVDEKAICQKKSDGVFSYIVKQNDGTVYLQTRQGTRWYSPLLEAELKDIQPCVIIGEALVKNYNGKELDRKTGNGLINSFIKRETTLLNLELKLEQTSKGQWNKLKEKINNAESEFTTTENNLFFECWDCLTLEEFKQGCSKVPYQERLFTLRDMVELSASQKLKEVDTYLVTSINQALALAKQYMEQGYEGAILKNPKTPFVSTTSKLQVKIKAQKDCDLICTGIVEGQGQFVGQVGSLICESACGNVVVNVGTGLTNKDREKPFEEYIGKIIEVQYNERIKAKDSENYSLYLPVFVEVRFDKNKADVLEEIE